MNNYLILRSENSPYNDVTKSSVLSFADMDNNLIFLKGHVIYTATTDNGIVTLKKYNGEDITFAGGGSGSGATNFTNGLTASTISATTYYNLPKDIFTTGGTYSNGTTTFTNNTGGTFNVTGFLTGQTDTYVTGLTFNNNILTLKQTNNQSDISLLLNNLSGLTINGNLTYTGQTNNPVYTAGTVTATHIPNWDNSNIQHVILSAATTSISGGTNIANGAVYTMILKQNASGSRVVTWGSQYKWQSAIPPILTSTPNGVDILTFISDGTNLYGLIAKDFR